MHRAFSKLNLGKQANIKMEKEFGFALKDVMSEENFLRARMQKWDEISMFGGEL